MLQTKGFSLIELLVAVAIILVIAALVVPNLLQSRISANEAAAVTNLRAINSAQALYQVTYPTVGYADSLSKLGDPPPNTAVSSNSAGLLDPVLACGTQPCSKTGYGYTLSPATSTPTYMYSVTAVPTIPGQTGVRGFCSDHENKVRFDPTGGTNCTQAMK